MGGRSVSNNNVKPKVKEINGELWQLDQNGNPIKKVKKKVKAVGGGGDELSGSVHTASNKGRMGNSGSSVNGNKNNNSKVKEIDGTLWQCDENGAPIKKLQRKGEKSGNTSDDSDSPQASPTSSKRSRGGGGLDGGSRHDHRRPSLCGSQKQGAPLVPSGRGRSSRGELDGSRHNHKPSTGGSAQGPGDRRGRSRSSDRQRSSSKDPQTDGRTERRGRTKAQHQEQKQQPAVTSSFSSSGSTSLKEYVDDKGRRVVIEADGSKTVFDKNGKKLRPKKKSSGGSSVADFGNASIGNMSFAGGGDDDGDDFDDVWVHGKLKAANKVAVPLVVPTGPSEEEKRQLLELQRQLEAAQEEIARIAEERERERAKNVKATTQVLQLKADHSRAEEEKQKLDLQIKNFEARLEEKEQKLQELRNAPARPNNGGGGDHLVSQIANLMAENDALVEKLKKEKALAAHELKRKEEELRFMQQELAQMRAENDMLFRGHVADKDPVVDKLYKEKKELEEKLNQKIQNLELKVVTLQEKNGSLKSDLEKATLEIKDDDDEDVRKAKEMAKAAKHGGLKNTADAKRASMWILNSLAATSRK